VHCWPNLGPRVAGRQLESTRASQPISDLAPVEVERPEALMFSNRRQGGNRHRAARRSRVSAAVHRRLVPTALSYLPARFGLYPVSPRSGWKGEIVIREAPPGSPVGPFGILAGRGGTDGSWSRTPTGNELSYAGATAAFLPSPHKAVSGPIRWRLRQIGHLLRRHGGTIAFERPGNGAGQGSNGKCR
jgi:hypothetical protein